MRRDSGGFYCPAWKVRINPYLGAGYSFLPVSPEPPGVKQAPNHPRVESGNMGTVRVCLFAEGRLSVETGKGTYGAESP
jgi:hypothetical protein